MHIELDLGQDILCLYTPNAGPGERIQHTRSTLLQKKKVEGEHTLFNLICSVTFNLIVSLPRTLSINAFLRVLLLSYNKHAYANFSQESDMRRHSTVYDEPGVDDTVKSYLRRVDQQNVENFWYCTRLKLFADIAENPKDETPAIPWVWHKAGSEAIQDAQYRQMRNINFIREVTEIDIHNDAPLFNDEVQYKILFDNHVILLHILERLKYGNIKLTHSEIQLSYSVRVLDPIPTNITRNRYELFKGSKNPIQYIEKQLNPKENLSFHRVLSFTKHYLCRGGLIHPSLVTPTLPNKAHTVEEMLAHATSSSDQLTSEVWDQATDDKDAGDWAHLKKVRKSKVEVFTVRHNPFFIDLSGNEHIHVEYFDGRRDVVRHDKTPSKTSSKPCLTTPSPRASLVKGPGKNQPLLRTFVAKIPEESKRKHQESEPLSIPEAVEEDRPKKIQRSESKQSTLKGFFKWCVPFFKINKSFLFLCSQSREERENAQMFSDYPGSDCSKLPLLWHT